MKKYKYLFSWVTLSFFLISFCSLNINAQTGPGGVGNSDGSNGQPQNVIWFAADSLLLSDTDPVAIWADESGNENNAVQAISGSQPQFRTGQINGLPAVIFDGTDDYMPFDGTLIENSDYTVIFVGARQSSNAFKVFLGGTTSATNQNLHLYWYNSAQFRAHQYGNDLQTDMVNVAETYSGGTNTGTYGIFATLLSSADPTDQRRNYQNNSYLGSRSNSAQLSSYTGAAIGRYNTGYHDVSAAELIIYSDALNDAQLQIIYEYLGEKYGITTYNDLYSPTAGYGYGLIGIGEESNGEHSDAKSAGFYLSALSGLNVGDYVFASHNNLTNNSANFRTNIDVTAAGAEEAYNRLWYVDTVGTPAAQIAFDFSEALEDGLNPANISNYSLLYRAGTSGNFTKVKNADGVKNGDQIYFNLTDADLKTGYYTLATEDATNSPLEGVAGRTWYTLISGDWDDWEIWTLDPSGALPNNPGHYTPSTSPTNSADDVVILTGRTVTVSSNNLNHSSITVEGRLDLQATSGHSFGEIRGTGRILMAADNFPAGDASHFYTKGQGEGTVEYYGGSYNLNTAREFYDVEVILDDPANTVTLTNDYDINGNLTITTGQVQINDGTNDRLINLTVSGDVLVDANGQITVGTGNPFATQNYQIGSGNMPEDDGVNYHDIYHQFTIFGDFTNKGTCRLTNLNAPDYNSLATNGAVTMRFVGTSNSEVNLYNTTDLYNLVIDKGVNKTYRVNVYSDNASYFRLYGANSVGRTQAAPFSAEDPQVRKALFVYHGTLQLRGNIDIPSLSEGSQEGGNGDYAIGKNARLWLDGNNVTVYSTASDVDQITGFTSSDTYTADGVTSGSSNQAMSIYGEFKITNGYFGTRNSAGFIFWAASNAQLKIEGGTCYVAQVRSAAGGGGVASYVQTGGVMQVFGNESVYGGEYTGTYPLFGLESSDAVFQMSGGDIILEDDDGDADPEFHIISDEGNYQVTGGTVTFNLPNGRTAQIQSTANLWNLDITNSSATGNITIEQLADLTVLGDFNLNNNTTFESVGFDLNIGGDWDYADGATYTHGGNTVSFVGNGRTTVNISDNSTLHDLVLNNVTLNKDQRWNNDLFHRIEIVSPNTRPVGTSPLLIEGNLTIARGEFDVNRWEVDLHGNIEIVDGQIIETDTPDGKIVLNGSSQQTIKGSETAEQEFGSFQLDNANGALLLSNINITSFELSQGIMDLDIYNLDVSDTITTSGTYSSTLMYKTAGNASDGGITRYIDLSYGTTNTEYLFPFGTGTSYTPAKVIQSATIADAGKITINPVSDYHPSTSDFTKTIPYYWVVDTTEFSSLIKDELKYTFEYPGAIPTNAKKGFLLWDQDYDWYDYGNILSGSTIPFPYSAYLTGDFTLGNTSVFQKPRILYSRVTDGLWDDKNSWSEVGYGGTATNKAPTSYDIIKIGYEGSPGAYTRHRITLDIGTAASPTEIAGLVLEQNPEAGATETEMSRLIIPPTRGLKINGKVSGDGEIQFQMDGTNIPTLEGDFGEFVNTEGASFIMRSNNGNVIAPTNLTRFPRLSIPGASPSYAATRSVTFTTDIYCHNLNVRYGGTLLLNNGVNGDIEVRDSLRIGGIGTDNEGRIIYQNNGTARTIKVGGDLVFDTDGATYDHNQLYVETGGTDNLEHRLQVSGNIILRNPNSFMDLWTANDGLQSNVILELVGEENGTFTDDNSTVPELYRIIMNKGGAGNPRFDFDDPFTLNGPTDSDPKALELISGTIDFGDSGIDIMLSSGGEDFKIPEGTELQASWAKMRVSGNNTGIWLDGAIRVGYASEWYINEGTNNYIEYTSSGTSEIDIYQGSFYVGSQIRRSATTEEGILTFRQQHDNSTVVIGTNADQGGETDRGVFELVNTGSYFSQVAGAKMTIANGITNATIPAFYIDLDASEVDLESSSIIAFGNSDTEINQNMNVYSSVDLKNVEIDNISTNDPVVTMSTVSLTLDTLTVESGANFDANGLDLILKGNMIVNGTFTSNQNNTYFSGTTNQQITGSPVFYNLYKTTSNQLIINNDIDVDNELELNAGTFNDNDNTLSVQGAVNMDITHTWGGSSDGILMNGSSQQVLTGNGTFGKLSVNNSSGILLPQGNNITIDGALQLESGVLDIGKNLLVLKENAKILEPNPFSETNMIQTNISFTDAGVKKYFPAIVPSDNYSFIYPLGSEGKYTPVEIDIDNVNAGGSIRVKAANEMHPTIINDTEPCNEIEDTANVLKYHWVMEANGITGFTADARMKYYVDDYQENSAFYDVTDYIAARLLFGSTLWNKYDQASFDEANTQLKFSFTNADDDGISGDYTAGIEDQGGTCEGAIPDEVPAYITIANGNWTDSAIWDTYPVSGGTVPSGGPRGAIAIVEHEVTIPGNYIVSYKTQINATGIVKVGTTFGHRLGIVEGNGTLQLERGNLPAGVYDDFFSRSGGTIEFTGSDDYDVLSEVNNVRNIIFSGTGERRLPNLDFEVYGEFTIDGSDGNLWVINEHDRDMTLDSNVVFNQGKFDAGINPSTVTFGGTQQQVISGSGSFTGTNAFRNVILNNVNGITLSSPVEIDGTLTFSSGIISTDAVNILTIDNASETCVSGYNSTMYVDGPMRKLVQTGGDFVFPLGDAGRYGPVNIYNTTNASSAYWIAQYFNSGYVDNSFTGNLAAVSTNEYWDITNPTSGDAAEVELRWDSSSDITPLTTGDINQIVVAEYNGSAWEDVTSDTPVGNNYDGTVKTTNAININTKHYTLGSEVVISAQAYFTTLNDVCQGDGIPVSFAGVDGTNLNFTLDYDYFDGSTTTSNSVTVSALPYSLPTADGPGTYTLTAFDYNNPPHTPPVVNGVVEGSSVTVISSPSPSIIPAQITQTFCAGETTNYSVTNNVGNTYFWSVTGGTILSGQGTNTIAVQWLTGPGDVTITETNSNSCSGIDNINPVTVNALPEAFDQNPTDLCSEVSGENAQVTGVDLTALQGLINTDSSGDSFTWYEDAGLTTLVTDANPDLTNVTINVTINGGVYSETVDFYCVVENSTTGCSDVATVTYTIKRIPETGPQYHLNNP